MNSRPQMRAFDFIVRPKHNRCMSKRQKEKDIFDHTEELGSLAVKAHKTGGMPLVFVLVGVIFLVFGFFSFMTRLNIIVSIILIVLSVLFFAASFYLSVRVRQEVCPKCGKNLIIKNSKNGRFYACPGFPDCRFTKSI